MNPIDVRSKLVDALRLDLIGPTGTLGTPDETLFQAPARWNLTGFLVPTGYEAPPEELAGRFGQIVRI